MCGIVGIVGEIQVAGAILEALRRLEYRGYDSAGVATVDEDRFSVCRVAGKLASLATALHDAPLAGTTGIGHTRWATHGKALLRNAHPQIAGRVAVVHNGIIENHQEIRADLASCGRVMQSDTDTEVIAHLLDGHLVNGLDPATALRKTVARITGAYAFAAMMEEHPDLLLVARRYSPLAIGVGEGEMFIGSDALALAPYTRRIVYLEDGDWALVGKTGASIFDAAGRSVERPVTNTQVSGALIGKGRYRHYMAKEIDEQPEVVAYTLFHYHDPNTGVLTLPAFPFDPATLPKLTIVAAGTSHYAGMVAKYWFESLARLPVEVDIASEFRYRDTVLPEGGAVLLISQSGESLDTLMALRHARDQGQHVLGLVNVPESTIEREADSVMRTHAGIEICVATTKAFMAQLVALVCLAVGWGLTRDALERDRANQILDALARLPGQIAAVLSERRRLRACAQELAQAGGVLYLGRGSNYPIALEGALKLKELSYIHAEGHAAGEMKHGPIALLEDGVPVVIVAPPDRWFDKTVSNATEAFARGGRVMLLSDRAGLARLSDESAWQFELPSVDPIVAPMLYTVPVQLLAYFAAVEKGTDVDQPRNLAKSVTVE